jgi:hypothetical protein
MGIRLDITERVRAEETARRLTQQHQRLLEVAQSMLATLALDEILARVQHALSEVVAYDGFGLYCTGTPDLYPAASQRPGPRGLRHEPAYRSTVHERRV